MNKRLLTLLVVLVMTFTSVPVAAAGHSDNYNHHSKGTVESIQAPVVFNDTITVTEKGGKFTVGFVTLDFKKDFLPEGNLPATFYVKILVKNGEAGVEINPDTDNFNRKVLIKVDKYEGLLYDEILGKNIRIGIKNQVIAAEHFSWYRFR